MFFKYIVQERCKNTVQGSTTAIEVDLIQDVEFHKLNSFILIGSQAKCTIEPSNGTSLDTKFNITCSVGNSPKPLHSTYEFGYNLPNGLHVILYSGNRSSFRTELISHVSSVETIIRDAKGSLTLKRELNVSVRIYYFL